MLLTPSRRRGFTLVELMVAAAVCVLIMAVLATAFSLGIDTMRQMKSTGDMMGQLRGATVALRADLMAPHLLDRDGKQLKLTDLRWDLAYVYDDVSKAAGTAGKFAVKLKIPGGDKDWEAPAYGFMRIGSGTLKPEGSDPDGLASGRATTHFLHFTSILPARTDEDYYTAYLDQKNFAAPGAEIAYFLDPTPTGNTGGPGTPTLHRLIRRQRIVPITDTERRDRPWPRTPDPAVVSLRPLAGPPTSFFLNTMAELTAPANRLGQSITAAPLAGPADGTLSPIAATGRVGEDVLLSNVISFEVQVNWDAAVESGLPKRLPTVRNPDPYNPLNLITASPQKSDHPFDVLPNPPANGNNTGGLNTMFVYDSWSNDFKGWTTNLNQTSGVLTPGPEVPPLLVRVKAVQIRIRVWDPKFQNARQVTIVQDL